jgi:Phosphotriesterase family
MSRRPHSRRDIIRMIGASATVAFAHILGAAEDRIRFPSGAVIRTVLNDLPPEALSGGATDSKAELPKAICRRGAFVGFDRQGGPGDSNQVPAVMALLDAGYADKLLFSSDFSFASDLKRSGGAGYAKTVTVFGPTLRNAGVTQKTLHGILVDNPRRFLAFIPKMGRGA